MTGQANLLIEETEMLSSRVHAAAALRDGLVREIEAARQARIERRIDICLQSAIAVLTAAALWLITGGTEYARWGHVVGLASQPFYIVASWRARQWGMCAVAIALCGIWLRGIANTFF